MYHDLKIPVAVFSLSLCSVLGTLTLFSVSKVRRDTSQQNWPEPGVLTEYPMLIWEETYL